MSSNGRRLIALAGGAAILFFVSTLFYRSNVASLAHSSAGVIREHISTARMQKFIPDSIFADDTDASPVKAPILRPQTNDRRPGVPQVIEDNEPVLQEEEDPLAYRKHLEREHAAYQHDQHRATLGFSNIYVLSLKTRQDRRDRMSKLAKALGLRITFVDAVPKDSDVITWIGERAAEVRAKKRPILSEAYQLPPEHTGGMKIGSMWLHPSYPELAERLIIENPITGYPVETPVAIDFPSLDDERYGGKDWVQWLESQPLNKLIPEDAEFNVTEAMWDQLEANPYRQVNNAVHSTWYSQTRVMEMMRQNNDESALVLEDDVDIEWDIGRIWPNIERHLPKEGGEEPAWQIVFLGHCWGREQTKATYMHPMLHPSTEPRCLHGYALSRSGYTEILRFLRDPWTAYQTAIDTAIPNLIRGENLQAFSVDPSIIIQSKDTPSDIQVGIGSPWRGILADSTMERIWRDEGRDVPDLKWADMKEDPASFTHRITREKAAAERDSVREDRLANKAAIREQDRQRKEEEKARLAAERAEARRKAREAQRQQQRPGRLRPARIEEEEG